MELAIAVDEAKDALLNLGIVFAKLPPRKGLNRFQTLQLAGLLIDLRREYGFMCWELAYAAEEAVRSYGSQARRYVRWVFECEWDSDIESWRDFVQYDEDGYPINKGYVAEVPDDDPGFDPRFLI